MAGVHSRRIVGWRFSTVRDNAPAPHFRSSGDHHDRSAVQPPRPRAGLLPRPTRVLLDPPPVDPSSGSAVGCPCRLAGSIADLRGALDPKHDKVLVTHLFQVAAKGAMEPPVGGHRPMAGH